MGEGVQSQQETTSPQVYYDLWFGAFLNHMPAVNVDLVEYCRSQQIPVGDGQFTIDYPEKTAELIALGFVPSPSVYDFVSESNTATYLFETWNRRPGDDGQTPKTNHDMEVESRLDARFGKGNWGLVPVTRMNDTRDPMAKPLKSILFLKKGVAVEKYGLAEQFARYPDILEKLQ